MKICGDTWYHASTPVVAWALRRADLLVGADEAEQDVVVLIEQRAHRLEAEGGTAGTDLEVDARAPERAAVRVGRRVDLSVGADQLIR